jgi:hypothetical protein
MANETSGNVPSNPGEGFRFSIGFVLVLLAIAAFIAAALFALPPVISAMTATLMAVCLPAMLASAAIYGGHEWRAFAIGMLLPTVLRVLGVGIGVSGSLPRNNVMAAMLMQRAPFVRGGSVDDRVNAFSYFSQMAEMWDRSGYAMMTDECLFWLSSTIAGLASLMVQRHFARRKLAAL